MAKLPDEGFFKLGSHANRQEVNASTVGSRKVVAKTRQRKGIVADAADHVFRLPQFSSGDAASRVKCI